MEKCEKYNLLLYARSYSARDYQWLYGFDSQESEVKSKLLQVYNRFTGCEPEAHDVAYGFFPLGSRIVMLGMGILPHKDCYSRSIRVMSAILWDQSNLGNAVEAVRRNGRQCFTFWSGIGQAEFHLWDSELPRLIPLSDSAIGVQDMGWKQEEPARFEGGLQKWDVPVFKIDAFISNVVEEKKALSFFVGGFHYREIEEAVREVVPKAAFAKAWAPIARGERRPGTFGKQARVRKVVIEIQARGERKGFFQNEWWWGVQVIDGWSDRTFVRSYPFNGRVDSLSAGSAFDRLVEELLSKGWRMRHDQGAEWYNVRLESESTDEGSARSSSSAEIG